jgi:cob(I)alamin adenosyltransferase
MMLARVFGVANPTTCAVYRYQGASEEASFVFSPFWRVECVQVKERKLMEKGYVQVYTGAGKGKTTAALGLGLRAVGRGFKVLMVQFLKGAETGELNSVKRLAPDFQLIRPAQRKKFFWSLSAEDRAELRGHVESAVDGLWELAAQKQCDVLILDEIMAAMHAEAVSVERVCDLIDNRLDDIELVLTGRSVPEPVAERADLITEMKPIKHYIDEGVQARLGIEK